MSTMQHHGQDARTRADGPHEYHVRVRDKVYLWGSAGITHNLKFKPAPVLHIWNDTFGEPVAIGTHRAGHGHTMLGTLQPNEHFAVELHEISGVFAECTLESLVACAIGHH